MRKIQTIVVIAGLVLSLTSSAQIEQTPKAVTDLEPLPRDLEIQLALSALPPHLRDNATVYVLNPAKGFEVARKGTNGFHALVARTGDDTFRGAWPLTEYRDDILYPISFDKAGAKAQLRVFLDAAEMQAKGTPPGDLKTLIQDRHKTGYYNAPERAGVSYMLSPLLRTYFNPEESDRVITVSFPHVMYFAPHISNEDIGAGKPLGPYPIVILHGHHGYMVQPLGVTESAAINKEYEEMLAILCNIKDVWCLPKRKSHKGDAMKVLALVYPGMTLLDLVGPLQAWSFLPGYEVQYVWHRPGTVLTDCGLGVQATHSFEDAWSDLDVLLSAAVRNPRWTSWAILSQSLLSLIAGLAHAGCAVFAPGALLLGAAGLLRGYRAAVHWGAREALSQFGAEPSSERVCVDRNRLTGGGITAGVDFGIAVAGLWAGDGMGRVIELIMEYAPQPPYASGRPELADTQTLATARAALQQAMTGAGA